ncbi:MAG: ATP-binding cassette domain-containing protein [Verrucomicrobia bacterium]|nr:ATP-binding cassette domain-containing protein [Verrucomicrobiota bacterium]
MAASGQGATGETIAVTGLALRQSIGPAQAPTLSFACQPGEILIVLGANGSGKSLLVHYLAGLFAAEPGVVRVCGCDLADKAARRKARGVLGVVFERPALARALTVAENVALPLVLSPTLARAVHAQEVAEIAGEVNLLLRLVGIEAHADSYPHELSAGEATCAALARALAGGKRVLVCDEPTAGLAPDRAYQIEELIKSLVRRGDLEGALICTHDLQAALRLGDRFLLLGVGPDFGRALVYGGRETLRRSAAFQQFLRTPPSHLFFTDATHDATKPR